MLRDVVTDKYRQTSEGLLALYDQSRSKWLSAARQVVYFGINHIAVKPERWLKIADVYSLNSGFELIRDMTVVAASIKVKNITTGEITLKYYRGGSLYTATTLQLTAEAEESWNDLDIDLEVSDVLVAVMTSGEMDCPVLSVELATKV